LKWKEKLQLKLYVSNCLIFYDSRFSSFYFTCESTKTADGVYVRSVKRRGENVWNKSLGIFGKGNSWIVEDVCDVLGVAPFSGMFGDVSWDVGCIFGWNSDGSVNIVCWLVSGVVGLHICG